MPNANETDATIAVNEALHLLNRYRITAKPMTEAEVLESLIENIRFVITTSNQLTREQKSDIEQALCRMERIYWPPEPLEVPPGLGGF